MIPDEHTHTRLPHKGNLAFSDHHTHGYGLEALRVSSRVLKDGQYLNLKAQKIRACVSVCAYAALRLALRLRTQLRTLKPMNRSVGASVATPMRRRSSSAGIRSI